MASSQLPPVLAPLAELPAFLAKNPDKPMAELLEPYRKYEAHLRRSDAQGPNNKHLKNSYVNALPLFTKYTPHITFVKNDPGRQASISSGESSALLSLMLANWLLQPTHGRRSAGK
jgi:hypothetical protein